MLEELLLDFAGGVWGRDEWITCYFWGMNRDWASRSHHVSPTCSILCFLLYATKGVCVSCFKERRGDRSRSPLRISFTTFLWLAWNILVNILDLNYLLVMLEGIFDVVAIPLVISFLLFSHLSLHSESVRDLFKWDFSRSIHLDTKQ